MNCLKIGHVNNPQIDQLLDVFLAEWRIMISASSNAVTHLFLFSMETGAGVERRFPVFTWKEV